MRRREPFKPDSLTVPTESNQAPTGSAVDIHSFSNPHQVRIEHLFLDLEVLFDRRVVSGAASLQIANPSARYSHPLILDTMDLKIERVFTTEHEGELKPARFSIGPRDPIMGAPLTIDLPGGTSLVRVEYSTSPDAAALQWLEPSQTTSKENPFVFTQSQSIHARSWIPLQDSPQVRTTYAARIRTPRNLLALMSAANNREEARRGVFTFRMRQPIPSYLIALAVGDLEFAPLGPRSGVYAEPAILKSAAAEFDDTERMMAIAESLYGPYRWDRYDLLVLPPSFPFGGMENPRLTFVTPTALAGDKSLVSLVAHELSHSWSGNLVTNATWRDFWLNEGFTVYVERRIVEEVYGASAADMEATLGFFGLRREMATLSERDEIMHVDLTGRNPDEGFTEVPYEKGALFLKQLEQTFGRTSFDQFLRQYFDHFAFQSITTSQFAGYLKTHLLDENPELAKQVPVDEWLYKPGIPDSAPQPGSDALDRVERTAREWLQERISADRIGGPSWTTQEWLHFLRKLPEDLGAERMAELDKAHRLTDTSNAEIACQWLVLAVRNSYEPAYDHLERFMTSIGRLKFLKPLYQELVKTTAGKERARNIYRKARPLYHPLAVAVIDQILNSEKA